MTKTQELYQKAKENGRVQGRKERLQLATKVEDENGNFRGTKPTGEHVVEFLDDEFVMEETYTSNKKVRQVKYTFKVLKDENLRGKNQEGKTVTYTKPIYKQKDDDEKQEQEEEEKMLHYFPENMNFFDYGDRIELEYIPKGDSGYIQVNPYTEDSQENEDEFKLDDEEMMEEEEGTEEESEEEEADPVDVDEDIPF